MEIVNKNPINLNLAHHVSFRSTAKRVYHGQNLYFDVTIGKQLAEMPLAINVGDRKTVTTVSL